MSPTSLTAREGGAASYTVRISNAPLHPARLNLGTPGLTGQMLDEKLHRTMWVPSGWTADDEGKCRDWSDFTIKTWNQAVTVALSIEDDEVEQGNEVGLFTHSVFSVPYHDLCFDPAEYTESDWEGAWANSAYHPYRAGPAVLVTRYDDD